MSTVRTNNISNLSGTGPVTLFRQVATKAWANLNGTGTIALRDSFNIASTVDNGTGDYSYNFTNAMANDNYCGQITMTRGDYVIPHHDQILSQTSTTWRSNCTCTPNKTVVSARFTDTSIHLFQVVGDLA